MCLYSKQKQYYSCNTKSPKVLTAELTMISLDAHTHMSIIVIEPKYYLISSIDKKFPEGSLNHAIFGLP